MSEAEPWGSLAEQYHVASRNSGALREIAAAALAEGVGAGAPPPPIRLEGLGRVALPEVSSGEAQMPLAEAILRRRSTRAFGEDPLKAEQLAVLLRLGNGVVRRVEQEGATVWERSAPSSGGRASIEIFPIALRVEGVSAGIYHYDAAGHFLTQLREGQFAPWLGAEVFLQPAFATAGAVLVLTAGFSRLGFKYGLRGYRLGLLDAGHVSENLYLAAASLGLPVCAVGGFVDGELDRGLGLDGLGRASVLVVAVGSAPVR